MAAAVHVHDCSAACAVVIVLAWLGHLADSEEPLPPARAAHIFLGAHTERPPSPPTLSSLPYAVNRKFVVVHCTVSAGVLTALSPSSANSPNALLAVVNFCSEASEPWVVLGLGFCCTAAQ